ncbi:PREDICTED: germin-like protein subfamily 3 member 4 [Camelina sativa]|uniref:Germin-like protein n=1 Tax=Camelina sativa TaxID=90675 RepID=A0ABM0UP39_CAMSA|nr:PREDICTED: germin-like protein subfamily 3 member 4 [Camelina sativa]
MKTFVVIMFCAIISSVSPDPDNMQDTCPTAPGEQSTFFINGYPCKNPTKVNAQDFKSSKLTVAGDTNNYLQSNVTLLTALEFPGLNTLGLSVSRMDLERDGTVPFHSHPRSSELLFVVSGVVFAGFVDTNNKIFQTVLRKGDVFVFPKGLLHFCLSGGFERATALSFYNSQNPGVVTIGGVFGIDQEHIKNMMRSLATGSGSLVTDGDEL